MDYRREVPGDLIGFTFVYRVRPTVLSRMRAITRRCCEDSDHQYGFERSIQFGYPQFCGGFEVFGSRFAKTVFSLG